AGDPADGAVLPDPRRARGRAEPAGAGHPRLVERAMEGADLPLAPDEGAVAVEALLAPRDGHEAGRRDRLGLALERERLEHLDLDPAADEGQREIAQQHLPRAGGPLEPGGDVDPVTRGAPQPGPPVA